jgi:hypothetical protein
MKNDIREMLKNVIQENAISFKENTAKVLYAKVGTKLEEKYKALAKTIMEPKNETNN